MNEDNGSKPYPRLLAEISRVRNNGDKVDDSFYSALRNYLASYGQFPPPTIRETQHDYNTASAYAKKKRIKELKKLDIKFDGNDYSDTALASALLGVIQGNISLNDETPEDRVKRRMLRIREKRNMGKQLAGHFE